MERIKFAKLSGSGNDFICIDNRDGRFDEVVNYPERVGHFARTLCRRGLAVGADGVIFAGQPEIDGVSDIGARFFEADGSEAELCGNGAACFVRWVTSNGWVPDGQIKVLTVAGVVLGSRQDGRYVRVCIPLPENIQTDLDVLAAGVLFRCDYAIAGVPHLVTQVEDIDLVDVGLYGSALRHHARFQPRGVNANFVQVLGPGEIAVRTFEYGVEGETLACGTGSAASAVLTAMRNGWGREYRTGKKPILVRARSGQVLRIYVKGDDDGTLEDLCLETVVQFAYSAEVHPELAARALNACPKAEPCGSCTA